MSGFLVVAVLLGAVSSADRWPAFRGAGNSISTARDLPVKWDAESNLAWTIELPGYGQSSPVVWRDRVFATSSVGNNKETAVVQCIELKSGRTLWRKDFVSSVPAKVSNYISRAAPTPAVDAERVYAFFEVGNLLALDHHGQLLWQRSLTDDYGKFLGHHGLGSSLALTADTVIILVDHAGSSYLLAVDKATGKTIWKADRDSEGSWSSPIVEEQDGNTRIIVSASGTCEAIDANTGKRLWHVEGLRGNTVPSATVTRELVVIGSSENDSNLAVRRGGKGNVTRTHIAWRSQDASATFSSPLVYQGHVYMVNRAGVAFCLDEKTGAKVWTTRVGESCWASPLGAGQRVYFFGKSGRTMVVATGPELNVLAENRLPTGSRVYGVAAVDGRLLIRTASRLTCVAAVNAKVTAPVKQDTPPASADKPPLPDLPQAITSFGAARAGNALYVYGGHHGEAHHYSQSGQSNQLLRLSLDDPGGWQVISTGPKRQGLALVAHSGKLYRIGGFTARNKQEEDQDLWSDTDFARFDPATKKWEQLPAMPHPRSSFDAAVVGDTLYVVGGWSMQGDQDTVWHDTAYAVDLSREPLQWQALPMPPFRRRALSVGTLGGKLYVIGGMQPDGNVSRETAVFDPQSQSWSKGPELPGDSMEGFGTACCPLDGQLFVSTASGKVLRLSDDAKSWQLQQQLPVGRFFHRMLAIDGKRLGLIGGANMKRGRFAGVEIVDVKP